MRNVAGNRPCAFTYIKEIPTVKCKGNSRGGSRGTSIPGHNLFKVAATPRLQQQQSRKENGKGASRIFRRLLHTTLLNRCCLLILAIFGLVASPRDFHVKFRVLFFRRASIPSWDHNRGQTVVIWGKCSSSLALA